MSVAYSNDLYLYLFIFRKQLLKYSNIIPKMATEEVKETSLLKSFAAGGFGGMCLVLAGHPFDTIKVC